MTDTTDTMDPQALIGRTAVDHDGDKIGKIGQVYLDDRTNEPQWITVSTGLFGKKESLAPLYGARVGEDEVTLAVSKDLVKDAPNIDADEHLDDGENEALYRHYAGHLGQDGGRDDYARDLGRPDDGAPRDESTGHDGSARPDTQDAAGTQGHDTSGPTTDDAMTRSEERLHVGTQQSTAGRARLRKYVVTENVTTTVPVSHEEVRVEREPITDDNRDAALSGQDLSEEEHEVTLHAEEPVVTKDTVPVERVKLGTETVTEDRTVNEDVRKEQIDTPDVDQR